MNTKQIRQTILDLAIRGELVPQDPTDEPASVLLERIRAEKEQLIKDKKLKREKKDSQPIDEAPFELPEGWVWCRLGDLLINRDGERKPLSSSVRSKQIKKKYDYYGATGVIDKVDNYIFDEKLLLVGEDGANLLSKVKPNAFFAEGKYWVNNHAHILDATNKNLLDYVIIVINTISLDNYITGTAQPKLSQENLNKIPIPLPPLAEQYRILQKVEQLLTIVDAIEQLQEQLKALIKQTKNQVLNYAIAGKLTHQDPNDEPAEELLKRIGKTTATDTPYEKLPKGWAWCRLGDIGEIIGGGTPSTSIEEYWNGEISWITPADLSNYSDKYIAQGKRNITQLGLDNSSAKLIPKGSILFSTRAPIGYVVIADRPLSTNQGFKSLSLSINMSEEFVYYFLLAEKERIKLLASGTTFQELSASAFSKILIPLPPLAEQHRIVQQIETFFASFDQIEKELA